MFDEVKKRYFLCPDIVEENNTSRHRKLTDTWRLEEAKAASLALSLLGPSHHHWTDSEVIAPPVQDPGNLAKRQEMISKSSQPTFPRMPGDSMNL